ncbi:MAG TPA: YbfB/YjiJ family MFS transporter [Acetobacteraceae bacterium]|nr:YbfB/YjiJ family MFS transporter [Acetobacteraceae bacterium]
MSAQIIAPAIPSRATATACGGMIAMAAALGIGRFVYTPILPAMMSGLGLSKSAAGLIASANFLGYLLGALLAAWPNLPGTRRTWLLGSLAISGLTTAAMGLTQAMPAFLLLRFIGGAASAIVLVYASAIVLEHVTGANRPALSAVHFGGVGVGIAVSAVLVTALLQAGEQWSALWWTSGLLSLAATVIVAALLHDSPSSGAPIHRAPTRATNPALLRLIVAYGLFGFGYVITATFLVAIVRGSPTIHALEPIIWVIFGLAAVPSVALWGRLASRLGLTTTFAIASVVEAIGVLASVAWPSAPGAFLAAMLVGGTFMGLTALGLVRARALTSGDPRRTLALMTGAFGLGQIVGPSYAGFTAEHLGSFAVPSATAVSALLLAAFLVGAITETAAGDPAPPR